MKRPMLAAGIAACVSSAFMLVFGINACYVLVAVSIFAAAMSMLVNRFRITVLIVATVILLVSARGMFNLMNAQAVDSNGKAVVISGTVTNAQCSNDYATYTVKLKTVGEHKNNTKILLYSPFGIGADPGDNITASAVIKSGESMSNREYNYSCGIYATASIEELQTLEHENNIYTRIFAVREHMTDTFFSYLKYDEASVMTALTSGDKYYISDELNENVRNSGVSHVMVVSGMHIAIIAGAFMKVLRKIRVGTRAAGALGLLLVAFITGVTGFAPSAMRAGLTYVIIFSGMIFSRRPDALNSLTTALTAIMIINPFSAGNVSLQLSASATFGILVAAPVIVGKITFRHMNGFLGKTSKTVICVVVNSVTASIFSIPFTIWHFGRFSSVFALTNLLIAYPVSAILITAVCASVVSGIPFVCAPFMLVGGLLSRFAVFVINSFGCLPFSYIKVKNPEITAVIAAFIIVVFYVCITLDKTKLRKRGDADVGNRGTGIKETD